MRQIQPRKPPLYDYAIHGRPEYDDRIYDDESDEEVDARTRVFNAIAIAPPSVKSYFLRSLPPPRTKGMGGPHREQLVSPSQGAAPATVSAIATVVGGASSPPTTVTIIQHHGGQSYSVGGDPIVVTEEEDKVLLAFAMAARPMSRGDLERATRVANAPRIMKRLATRYPGFEAAVRRPGKKSRGGYYARVVEHVPAAE